MTLRDPLPKRIRVYVAVLQCSFSDVRVLLFATLYGTVTRRDLGPEIHISHKAVVRRELITTVGWRGTHTQGLDSDAHLLYLTRRPHDGR